MNFFEQFVIPPNQEHVGLLTAMQIISLLTFLPFIGIMLGASQFSLAFYTAGKKNGSALYLKLAKDIIDKLTIGKAAGYALGILPLITITLIYTQILYGAQVISVSLMFLALLLFIIGFVFMYKYKDALDLEHIIKEIKSFEELPENAKKLKLSLSFTGTRYGNWGISLIYTAIFLFVGAVTIAAKPSIWASTNNIMKLAISGPIWVNYFAFIFISFAITGGAMLYFFFVWGGGVKENEEYTSLIKKLAVNSAMIGLLIQPLFIFINILFISSYSASSSVYVFGGLTIAAILITTNLLYYINLNSNMKWSSVVFFLMFVIFTFGIVQDQLAFRNAVKEHLLAVNVKAEEIAKEKQGSVVQVSGADGEKIYNEKCIACHKFDQKLVGPPYQETIPKYNGDVKKLAAFIHNPQKVNPAYPPMPNQGLKQKEAEAIAKWLIDKVGKK